MKLTAILIFPIILLCSCSNRNYSKDIHLLTREIDDSLYHEIYTIYDGGVLGGRVDAVYLTDSSSFRKYVGKNMDYETIIIKFLSIDNDAIIVCKFNSESYKVLDANIYHISKLKEEGEFE
jgi:hypothetical protein